MLGKWFVPDNAGENGVLELEVLTERDDVDEEALFEWLGREVSRNYVSPGELELIFADLGAAEVVDHLKRNKFPTDPKVRNGEFGEVIAAALFRNVRRWCMPVLKLRYKQRPNQPVQGADIVGFRLRQTPPAVAVPEVKTRTSRRLDVGVDAHKSLEQAVRDLPQTITFVVNMLNQRGNPLAGRVARLLTDYHDIERNIVLVHDDARWSDVIIRRLADAAKKSTKVTIVRIRDLGHMIEKAYESATGVPGRRTPKTEAKSA